MRSTGGIIALGLTARNWTVRECITQFQSLCSQAFTQRKGTNILGVEWFVKNYFHSKYETQPLEEALISSFGDEQYLFGGRRSDPGSMDVKVAVTATSASGNGVVLANYNRLCTEKREIEIEFKWVMQDLTLSSPISFPETRKIGCRAEDMGNVSNKSLKANEKESNAAVEPELRLQRRHISSLWFMVLRNRYT